VGRRRDGENDEQVGENEIKDNKKIDLSNLSLEDHPLE